MRPGDVSAPLLSQEENLLFHELERHACEEAELGGKGTKRLWDVQPSWNSSRLISKGLCEENRSIAWLLKPGGKLQSERKMGFVASPCSLLAYVVRSACTSVGRTVSAWQGRTAAQDGGSPQGGTDGQERVVGH